MIPAMSSLRRRTGRRAPAGVGVGLVQGFLPRRQRSARCRGRRSRRRPSAACGRRRRAGRRSATTPEIGGRTTCFDDLAGDRASDGGVQVRREALLRLDGGEVLHPVAGDPAQVLPEPVHQPREHHRVQRRPPVVVGGRVDREPDPDRPVGGQGQGEEHRRPVVPTVRRGVASGRRCAPPPARVAGPGHRSVALWSATAVSRGGHHSSVPGLVWAVLVAALVGGRVVGQSGSVSRCQPSAHC